MKRLGPLGIVALVGLVLILPIGVLYAYRSQTPAVQTISLAQAVQSVQDGRVREVDYDGDRATLTYADGTRQQTNTPLGGQDPLSNAALAWNQQNPSRAIQVRMQPRGAEFSGWFSLLLAMLPLLLLLLLVVLAARIMAAGRAPDPYERLARIADLRDRGVLTEEELQVEKRRLLK